MSSHLIAGQNEGFYTTEILPMFRLGFRYYACESYQHKPSAFKTIPFRQNQVQFSMQDRSPHVELSLDHRTIISNSGYRSARTSEPIRSGTYYYEVKIDKGGGVDEAHVRVGVSRREAESGAPVGYDGYSYGWRDINGHKVHLSRSQKYSDGFTTGDVVGVLVHLPINQPRKVSINKTRIPIKYKELLWFELSEYPHTKEMDLLMDYGHEDEIPIDKGRLGKKSAKGIKIPRIPGSFIEFFKNGEPVASEPAYTDLLDYLPKKKQPEGAKASKKQDLKKDLDYDDGTCGYYPMVSLYKGGQATLNPGPEFAYPPNTKHAYKPLSDRFGEFWEEMRLLDDEACAELPDVADVLIPQSIAELSGTDQQFYGTGSVDGATPTAPKPDVSSQPPEVPMQDVQMQEKQEELPDHSHQFIPNVDILNE
ncbi:hypothetical protein WALSEDRAFT_68397 [Wallemia mellicola CBS 633.66]|uniref:B30.2/SPRY domain-containing protein n=2 Tax=Wallemia mellicola TaxID=1708541 RepID=I4YEQ1_WALMC|nr:hypothetical protein WALSEDRAFT_68397 [Wallemia mellicola CBS 633.66]TIC03841.1 hypothetical protein E3Q16_02967 [Wallemia mellicola]EIM22443.1 hypothetical protein WALSEDRAFT_68397 [Wallemia mellicola CBS 633.66]TIC10611.1 hypothetical protein E3Q15_03025 [Wallemia mellicola]TIC15599.1 hypothetical protein E3Q13_03287 [Wallemia mellicola]TIC43180.1 hypothetical protein E3Q08_02474 [Wallemia mellicola]|eukprot:XP_006957684.1 hypothetical protein WALSEDRAFT_68397 [Wallemia mellicola CBS 633.66]